METRDMVTHLESILYWVETEEECHRMLQSALTEWAAVFGEYRQYSDDEIRLRHRLTLLERTLSNRRYQIGQLKSLNDRVLELLYRRYIVDGKSSIINEETHE